MELITFFLARTKYETYMQTSAFVQLKKEIVEFAQIMQHATFTFTVLSVYMRVLCPAAVSGGSFL